MPVIRINKDVSAESIRNELASFGRFARVEVSTEPGVRGGTTLLLRKVGLGERLKRLFQSSRERQQNIRQSEEALKALLTVQPEFKWLLVGNKGIRHSWNPRELRDYLTPSENQSGRAPKAFAGRAGLVDKKVDKIAADCKISWQLGPRLVAGQISIVPPKAQQSHTAIAIVRSDEPDEKEMTAAYANALAHASGHLVMTPIDDVPLEKRMIRQTGPDGTAKVGYQSCSDRSIRLLLEAIAQAKGKDGKLQQVTIAAGDYTAEGLSARIKQQQAILDARSGPVLPPADPRISKKMRPAPAQAGIHFLKNSAFHLHADRVIVPQSAARENNVPFVTDKDARNTQDTVLSPGQLIAFNDSLIGDLSMLSPAALAGRFRTLLDGVHGTVVISPPICSEDQMQAIMQAVREACGKNRQLSVTFAIDDARLRESVTQAYGRSIVAEEDARLLDIDHDDDDEHFDPSRLWKTV